MSFSFSGTVKGDTKDLDGDVAALQGYPDPYQVNALLTAKDAVAEIAETLFAGENDISVSVSGHVNPDGTGDVSIKLTSVKRPAPAPVVDLPGAIQADPADETKAA